MLPLSGNYTTSIVLRCCQFVIGTHITGKMQKICCRKALSRFFCRYTLLKTGELLKAGSGVLLFINILKKNKKFNESVDIIHASGIQVREESVPAIIQAKQVVECIRMLPIGYRTVLNLYAVEGFSHREIAGMLDIEESTSRSQYTRAKAMLEDILTKKRIIQKPKQEIDWLMAVSQG
jgi:hypothetical protein